jgi:hypothetical protein
MRLKEMVMEMLQRGDSEGLEQLVLEQPSAIRYLQGRLWDAEQRVRQNAAEALGSAAANRPELGREILRRALWALNDESATNGAPVLPVIGEIGFRNPEVVAPFVGPMTSYLWDDGLRPGILRALSRIAESAPHLIMEVREQLLEIEHAEDPGEQACLDRLLAVKREGSDGV